MTAAKARARSQWRRTRYQVGNADVADALERVADLLEVQDGNPFRIRAYRSGAGTMRALDTPISVLVLEGDPGALERLPGIGKGLAGTIREFVLTGRMRLLDRLEGQVCPEDLLRTVPGIGPELARRIHRELDVESLEDLELAAHDGRLETVDGFGHRRAEAVRQTLSGMLGQASRRRALGRGRRWGPSEDAGLGALEQPDAPSVAALLSVDEEYRRKAAQDELPTIAPRRFNPTGEAWLPILHTDREGWHITALFSNTARAHELGRTHDWVVIYADGEHGGEQRFTVVTEYQGDLAGRRVVRGRELESRRYYG
jgi:Holliday junction resolvasome RuvABC DNA-binding subunit